MPKKLDLFCCGLKLRRKPFKQPPQFYCNSCGKNFIKFKGELIEGKSKNIVTFHGKISLFRNLHDNCIIKSYNERRYKNECI